MVWWIWILSCLTGQAKRGPNITLGAPKIVIFWGPILMGAPKFTIPEPNGPEWTGGQTAVKVGNMGTAISEPSWWINGNWKFGPSPRPHPHSDPIINTHTKQAQKLRMDLPPALFTCRLQPKTHCHPQKQRFGYPRLSKKIPRTPTKTDSSQGHSSKGQLPPAKLGMLFHVHLSVTEFWPHIYSLSPAQSSYQTSQIRPNTKMGGACNAERSTL